MDLSRIERETYINFNDEENEAVLCTYNSTWLRKLDELSLNYSDFVCRKREERYGEYVFPKKFVRISRPKNLTDEQREKLREGMHKARKEWAKK